MSSANSFIIYDCHPLKDALDQTKRVAGNPEHAFVDAGYRGHLKGVVSEQLNAILNSAGMNFHNLLRWKAAFYAKFSIGSYRIKEQRPSRRIPRSGLFRIDYSRKVSPDQYYP